MIALEPNNQDSNHEASTKCLTSSFCLQFGQFRNKGLADCKGGIHPHLGAESVGSKIKSGSIKESQQKTTYQHELISLKEPHLGAESVGSKTKSGSLKESQKKNANQHELASLKESQQKTTNQHELLSLKESQQKAAYQPELVALQNLYPDSNSVKLYPRNPFEALLYPYAVDNRFYVPPFMFPPPFFFDYWFQEFQYFVVIDFEATCDKDNTPHPQEIIEFPSVIVSSMTGQLEACFQTYVRPTCNQVLSDFCKDLTGIEQIQVDRGVTLSEALLRHDKWLEKKGIKNANFAVVTWSNWDCKVMLESECRYKKIRKPPYFNRWINLKVPFREVFGDVRCNLKEAVEMAGLVWQGRAHCGLDDARNTANLLALLMHRGFKFSITDSLTSHPPDDSFTWKTPLEHHPYQPPKVGNLLVPLMQVHPYCYCGVKSSKGMVRKPGPKQGSVFFGCGNWTAARGARCHYCEWASF